MKKLAAIFLTVSIISLILTLLPSFAEQEQPRVVSALEGQVPSDAVVLFDGKDISGWTYMDGQPAGWKVTDGAMTVKGGSIITRKEFGDIQLHLEFATPAEAKGSGQDRGNSGLYIQGLYEVQILDSYGNETYPDGSCAAIYKIAPPLVNASRPAGTWQIYDVIFRAPGFDATGNRIRKAVITVFHNGVLVQDHLEVVPTFASELKTEKSRGPIYLQDHNHPVKFRNIWVREL